MKSKRKKHYRRFENNWRLWPELDIFKRLPEMDTITVLVTPTDLFHQYNMFRSETDKRWGCPTFFAKVLNSTCRRPEFPKETSVRWTRTTVRRWIVTHPNLTVETKGDGGQVVTDASVFFGGPVGKKIRRTRVRRKAWRRRFYEHSKASGRQRVFLPRNWLSRIPAWNAHEDERYKMPSTLGRPDKWKRRGASSPRLAITCTAPSITDALPSGRAFAINFALLSNFSLI